MRDDVLEMAAKARVILVMGEKDTGKTTLVTHLANALFRRGFSVGVIDTDVGQSDIGPPTTIGFGTVETELRQLGDVVLRKLYFVGDISPKGNVLGMVLGARQMLDQAITLGVQKILFDTTGLVSGQLGRILKESEITAVHPDLIICLQKQQECEHILRPYASFTTPAILRIPPDSRCRARSLEERRVYRETIFQRYFADANTITCSLEQIGIFDHQLFSGEPREDVVNVLIGLLNACGECVGLGILRAVDFATRQAVLHTAIKQDEIAGITLSTYHINILAHETYEYTRKKEKLLTLDRIDMMNMMNNPVNHVNPV